MATQQKGRQGRGRRQTRRQRHGLHLVFSLGHDDRRKCWQRTHSGDPLRQLEQVVRRVLADFKSEDRSLWLLHESRRYPQVQNEAG